MTVQIPPLRVSEELAVALKDRAAEERRTPSAVARMILEDALLKPAAEGPHRFVPKPSNALRCEECGGRKVDH